MILSGLSEEDYVEIWQAPEGNDFAVQFRRETERDWCFTDYALSKNTAMNTFNSFTQNANSGVEYRVVRLSRYPPCSIVQVITYFES